MEKLRLFLALVIVVICVVAVVRMHVDGITMLAAVAAGVLALTYVPVSRGR